MKRFFWWILLFLLLLVSIPFFASIGQLTLAKIIGIVTVITLSVALWVWKRQSASKHGVKNRISINLNDRFWLNQHCPFYTSLSKKDKVAFTDRIGLFLGNHSLFHHPDLVLVKEDYIAIASSWVISTWLSFDGFHELNDGCFISGSQLNEQSAPSFHNSELFTVELKDVLLHFKSPIGKLNSGKNPWLVEK